MRFNLYFVACGFSSRIHVVLLTPVAALRVHFGKARHLVLPKHDDLDYPFPDSSGRRLPLDGRLMAILYRFT